MPRSCPKNQVQDEYTGKCYAKKHIIEHPPREVRLEMTALSQSEYRGRKALEREAMKRYNISYGSQDEDDETYGRLYYGADMRSEMGIIYEDELDFIIFPKHYVDTNPDGSVNFDSHYSKCWRRLIEENNPIHVKY